MASRPSNKYGIDVEKLYSTTDAQVWAQEFMTVVKSGAIIDEGLMIGWFANAMATAERHLFKEYSHK